MGWCLLQGYESCVVSCPLAVCRGLPRLRNCGLHNEHTEHTEGNDLREALLLLKHIVERERLSSFMMPYRMRTAFQNKDLKHILKSFKLKVGGNRAELVERLFDRLYK